MTAFVLPQEIIRKKRDGYTLSKDDIQNFVDGIVNQSFSDSQIAALAMAIFFQGLNQKECTYLTQSMAHSGTTLQWSEDEIPGPIIDKHSTGGVGDKVSIIIAPLLASCGLYVPMMCGRGLGHTEGTSDKMQSIPYYNIAPEISKFKKTVKEVGCAIIGQTQEMDPADKRFYSVRDISGTVESIPLITASILSKKLAAGLDGLILDVKYGSGAFMHTYEKAFKLASSLVTIAQAAKLRTKAVITDMNQVLGNTVGHTIEIRECIDYFNDKYRDSRLHEVTKALAIEALLLGKIVSTPEQAEILINQKLAQGQPREIFAKMIATLGGPTDLLENPDKHLASAAICQPIYPRESGYIFSMNTYQVGISLIELGGGRKQTSDLIDHRVGLSKVASIGTYVDNKTPLAFIHARNNDEFNLAKNMLLKAIQIAETKPTSISPVREVL